MTNGLSFRHPLVFWFGCALLVGGVFAHAPMFMMGQHTHWQMVGMPMTTEMWLGMAAIPVGLALSAFGMLPRLPGGAAAPGAHLHFHVADGPSLLGAEGLPFAFDAFELLGRYGDFEQLGQAPWEPQGAGMRRGERPPDNAVLRFPD